VSFGAKQAWIETLGTHYRGTGFHIGLELHPRMGLQNRIAD